ncbi:hypothetical protein JOM56_006715 [Amanita muscaria]
MTILELLYYDDHSEVDIAILKSCSLVCRAWTMPAQRLLFRHVTLKNQRALESFVDAIDRSTFQGCVRGDAVRRLRVTIDHNDPLGINQQSLALGVSLCPNLTGLSLALYGGTHIVESRVGRAAPLFDQQTVQNLTSGPAISELEFDNWSESEEATAQVLHIWPTLKSLSIRGTTPQLSSTLSDPFPCSLETLRLNFQTAPSDDYLKWLLHNSSESLRALEFEREPSLHLLEHLLTSHSATLQSLSLPSVSSEKQASIIQQCSQLRELNTESPSALKHLYAKLPETLEHMAFGVDKDSELRHVLGAVKGTRTLKTVVIQIWTGGELHDLSKLKIECACRGMCLKTNPVRLLRPLTRKAW